MTASVVSPVIPSSSVARPAGRGSADSVGPRQPLPVPALPSLRLRSTVYGFATLDSHGRIADRTAMRALTWAGGTRLDIRERGGVITVSHDRHGVFAVTERRPPTPASRGTTLVRADGRPPGSARGRSRAGAPHGVPTSGPRHHDHQHGPGRLWRCHGGFDIGDCPGTFDPCGLRNRLDYLLLSHSLAPAFVSGQVYRKGLWGSRTTRPGRWDTYPEMTTAVHQASDHAAITTTLDL